MSGEARQEQIGATRFDQAAGWDLRFEQADLHGTELTAEELREAEQFFADPDNDEALNLAARVASHVGTWRARGFVTTQVGNRQRYEGAVSPAPWPKDTAQTDSSRPPGRYRRHLATAGLAFAIVVLVVAGLALRRQGAGVTESSEQVFRTDAAENQLITLPDGSRVTLGARTELTVRFGSGRRLVNLERGEALFEVAHDRVHPFIVQAGRGTVTAIGTAFDIHRAEDRVTITVTEGSVLVAPLPDIANWPVKVDAPAVKWQSVRLEHGQEVTYDQAHDRGDVEAASPSAAEWTAGRFGYRHTPLKYILADVNRYRATPIVLKDAAAGEYGFTGTVFLDHTAEWLRSLEKILPLQVTRDSGDRIFIGSRLDGQIPDSRPAP
jgi:transmembrane sensor